MVEIFKNTISRIEPRKAGNAAVTPIKVDQASASAGQSKDSVSLSSVENQSIIKEMAAAPPVDGSKVSRIKEAIQRGQYPIDIDRVSDALMEAYRDIKSS